MELYTRDSYAKECDAQVVSVKEGKYIILDKALFYPRGGGQPCDTGKLLRGSDTFNVVFVGKFKGSDLPSPSKSALLYVEGKISHEVDREGLQEGDRVKCVLDWQRRHTLMRMHTAAHVLSAIIHNDTGALITGNNLDTNESRIDFNLENFDREKINEYVKKANETLVRNMDVRAEILPYDEAMKIPSVVKLAGALPPNLPTLRIVFIGDVDVQADGGLHVKNTSEVGQIEVTRAENKGKTNRRIYFKLNI